MGFPIMKTLQNKNVQMSNLLTSADFSLLTSLLLDFSFFFFATESSPASPSPSSSSSSSSSSSELLLLLSSLSLESLPYNKVDDIFHRNHKKIMITIQIICKISCINLANKTCTWLKFLRKW